MTAVTVIKCRLFFTTANVSNLDLHFNLTDGNDNESYSHLYQIIRSVKKLQNSWATICVTMHDHLFHH